MDAVVFKTVKIFTRENIYMGTCRRGLCLRRTGLTGDGIIDFYLLILYFSVHFIKNAYFALLLSWLQQFVRLCVTLCNLVT